MTKEASTYNGLKTVYSISGVGKIGQICAEKWKLDHLLTSHTRINSKWIKDLSVRLKSMKILWENIGSKISDIAHSKFLSDISPQAREIKGKKINKWDHIKLKSFCIAKETINNKKDNPQNGRPYLPIHLIRG